MLNFVSEYAQYGHTSRIYELSIYNLKLQIMKTFSGCTVNLHISSKLGGIISDNKVWGHCGKL